MLSIPHNLITTYLEMTDHAQFQPANIEAGAEMQLLELRHPDVAYYRFLYGSVGDMWGWRDRRLLTDAELNAALTREGTHIYVLHIDGSPCGYIELARTELEGEVEIAYLGVRPEYHGRGLGKHLLSFGIRKAWENGASRLMVHTCNLDAEAAIPNYIKRGFRVYRVVQEPMPERYKT